MPPEATLMKWARLNLVVSGRLNATLPTSDGIKTFQFKAGEGYFAPPGTWESLSVPRTCGLLCMVFCVRYLRVAYHLTSGRKPPRTIFFHTAKPYDASLNFTLEALCSIGHAKGKGGWLPPAGIDLSRAMIRFAEGECLGGGAPSGGKAAWTFHRVQTWLENAFKEPLTRRQAAIRFGLDPAYLTRLFVRMTGLSFHAYLVRLRLDHARELLRLTNLSVGAVGRHCGYLDHAHFVYQFRKSHGLSPGRYREQGMAAVQAR